MKSLLGVFPSFDSSIGGGVQTSGSVAWSGLAQHCNSNPIGLSYGPSGAVRDHRMRYATSRVAAVWHAINCRHRTAQVLFWHIDLLKLLPFMASRRTEVFLFLHGIEAWRPLPALVRRLLWRVDCFLSNSHHTWNEFVRFNPEFRNQPVRFIPLGVGSNTERPAYGSTPAAIMLGRMVRTEDYKGHREVLSAWPAVRHAVPDAQLWIIGDGDLRPELEQMASNTAGVSFFGFLPEDEKQRLIQEARCLALPSRNEGFGLVYLEAMRYGRPCLVSSLDAGREVVNPPEAGLAVDPDNRDELATALIALLQPGTAKEWANRSWERYRNHFTESHFQRRLVEALALPIAK